VRSAIRPHHRPRCRGAESRVPPYTPADPIRVVRGWHDSGSTDSAHLTWAAGQPARTPSGEQALIRRERHPVRTNPRRSGSPRGFAASPWTFGSARPATSDSPEAQILRDVCRLDRSRVAASARSTSGRSAMAPERGRAPFPGRLRHPQQVPYAPVGSTTRYRLRMSFPPADPFRPCELPPEFRLPAERLG